jgi:hypothetical protein
MDRAICTTVTRQRQRHRWLLAATDLYKWQKALRNQQVLTDSRQRTDPGPEQIHYGPGWVVKRNGCTPEEGHGGAEDWLGHYAMSRLVGADVEVVLLNAGTYQGSEWSTLVTAGLRK